MVTVQSCLCVVQPTKVWSFLWSLVGLVSSWSASNFSLVSATTTGWYFGFDGRMLVHSMEVLQETYERSEPLKFSMDSEGLPLCSVPVKPRTGDRSRTNVTIGPELLYDQSLPTVLLQSLIVEGWKQVESWWTTWQKLCRARFLWFLGRRWSHQVERRARGNRDFLTRWWHKPS